MLDSKIEIDDLDSTVFTEENKYTLENRFHYFYTQTLLSFNDGRHLIFPTR